MTLPSSYSRILAAAGAVLVLSGIPATTQAQEATDELVGYEAASSGIAYTLSPRVPALLPVESPFEGTMSLATATLSTGGTGFGRASTVFPGPITAGIRPLIEIASGQRLPLPDYPLVVESREFEPAKKNEQPGITMSSDVDPDRAVVVADAGGTAIPGVFGIHSSRTVSTSLVNGSKLSADSVATVEGLGLSDVVDIRSVVSRATTTTDAKTAACSGKVDVSGVTVAGQPATIDREGIHVDEQPGLLGTAAAAAAEEALSASGITARTIGAAESCTGANGNTTASGLLISIPLPEAGSVPAGGSLQMIVASASATVSASTLAPFEEPPFDPPTGLGDVVSRLPGPFAGGGTLDPVAAPDLPPLLPSGSSSQPEVLLPTSDAVDYDFAGVPPTLVVGLILLAIPGARRIRRYMTRALALTVTP